MPRAAPASLTVSQLSVAARVPVPRIKFYLREGLLPAGNLRAPGRAFYTTAHVQRLSLIHTLRQVAGLSISAIAELCQLLDAGTAQRLPQLVAHVLDALAARPRSGARPASAALTRARGEIRVLLRKRGIRVRPEARAVVDLAHALVGLRATLGAGVSANALEPYLDAMCQLAERDYRANTHLFDDAASAALAAALGTVLWEPVLLLLRRIAHEHVANAQVRRPRLPRGEA
jgi:DNA-binding transcriptional MerR regulator